MSRWVQNLVYRQDKGSSVQNAPYVIMTQTFIMKWYLTFDVAIYLYNNSMKSYLTFLSFGGD